MMRILSLPASFFREYSVGELNQHISYMDSLCSTIVDSVFSTAVTGVFSLIYLAQIFSFAPSLVWPSLIVTLATLGLSLISARVQMRVDQEIMVHTARERGTGADIRAEFRIHHSEFPAAPLRRCAPALPAMRGEPRGDLHSCV